MEVRIDAEDSGCRSTCFTQDGRRNRRSGVIERGIVDDKTLLVDAVSMNRLDDVWRASRGTERVRHSEAVIEPSITRPKHSLWRRLASRSRGPCKSNPRPKVRVVVNAVLALIAETITNRKVGSQPPVILVKERRIKEQCTCERIVDHGRLVLSRRLGRILCNRLENVVPVRP
jgi:hypothetical protein